MRLSHRVIKLTDMLSQRDLGEVRKKCRWLERQARAKGKDDKTRAIVFDLDDTLMHYEDKVLPIEPTLALLRACRAAGIQVHIVTARHGTRANRTCAKQDLVDLGLTPADYKQIWMRPSKYPDTAVAECKQRQRDAIVATGCRIFAAVGDQWWDLYEDDDTLFDRYGDKKSYLFEGRPSDGFQYALKLPSL